jgi:hypothetical protein
MIIELRLSANVVASCSLESGKNTNLDGYIILSVSVLGYEL